MGFSSGLALVQLSKKDRVGFDWQIVRIWRGVLRSLREQVSDKGQELGSVRVPEAAITYSSYIRVFSILLSE